MAKTLAQQIQIFSDNINNHIDSSFNSLNEKIDGIEISKVPTKTSELVNDSGFLTKHQDLSSYAKKDEVYTKDNVDSIATRINNNKQDILVSGVNIKTINGNSLLGSGDLKIKSNNGSTTIVDSSIDLSDYYTKEEVDNKVETSISTTLDNKHYLTEHQKLKTINGQSLVGTGDIMITNSTQPDLSNYVTETALDQKGFITKDNADKIYQSKGNYALKTDIPDMSEYAKKSDIENYNPIDVSSFVTKNDVSSFVTNTELDNKHYLTEHQSLAEYAKKTDLPDTTPFLTKTSAAQTYQTIGDYALKSDVAKINLDNYYNKDQIDSLSTLTNQRLASKQSTLVSGTNIKTINGNSLLGEGNLKITPDLSNYALKTDIPDMSEYAKKSDIENYNPIDVSSFVTKNDVSSFVTKNDVSSFVTKNDVSSFVTKNDVSNFVTNTELDNKHYLTEHQKLKTINGTSLVGTGNIQIDISQTDLSRYYTIKQVDNLLTKKQDTGDYVTNDELNKKGYLTEHQSLADYAKKSELPTDFYNKLHIDSSYNNLQAEIDSKQDAFDLSVYAKKTDLPDTTPFLTKTSATQTYQFKGDYALKSDVAKINLDNYYNKDQIDALTTITNQKLASKQNTLVSGTNIKTINGNSLLGEGDINISTYLSNYALKSDIPTDFYSKSYIDSSYNSLNTKIDSSYNSLNTKIDTKQDKGNYALKSDIPTDFYSKSYIDSSYNSLNTKIDTKQDKGDYALKSDIPTIVYTTQDNYNKMASYDDNTYYVIVG